MPPVLAWTVLLSNLVIAVGTWGVLVNRATRTALDEGTRGRFAVASAAYIIVWLAVDIALAKSGLLEGTPTSPAPSIAFGLLFAAPLIAGGWLLARSETLRAIVAAVPLPWLVGVQFYRALGAVFLVLHARGELPAEFALPAGWGDLFVGLSAPVVAYLASRRAGGSSLAVASWNTIGILDLVVAVTTGFLSAPNPFQRFALSDPNELITAHPLALIPLFAVPLSLVLHGIVFRRLRSWSPTTESGGAGRARSLSPAREQ